MIGIAVERREPLALKFWRRAEKLPLSGREIEVCLPLALGRSRAEIAERLGVSENTAINHCRNIYAKLGVQSRAELVEKLQDAFGFLKTENFRRFVTQNQKETEIEVSCNCI